MSNGLKTRFSLLKILWSKVLWLKCLLVKSLVVKIHVVIGLVVKYLVVKTLMRKCLVVKCLVVETSQATILQPTYLVWIILESLKSSHFIWSLKSSVLPQQLHLQISFWGFSNPPLFSPFQCFWEYCHWFCWLPTTQPESKVKKLVVTYPLFPWWPCKILKILLTGWQDWDATLEIVK